MMHCKLMQIWVVQRWLRALQSAYSGHSFTKDKQGYLFLITDGEIYDHHKSC